MLEAAITKIIKTQLKLDTYLGFVPEDKKRPAIALCTLGTVTVPTLQKTESQHRTVIFTFKVHALNAFEAKEIQYKLLRLFGDRQFSEEGLGYCYEMITKVIATSDAMLHENTTSVDVSIYTVETPKQQ
ncbi:hypothetical protein [Aeromonas veronii]|uniref:hypothetical protein n=1 Tax=Aeromonas veronii TaxID=654 RepID=UPI00366E7AE4